MDVQTIKRRFIEEIKLRAYDDHYVDKAEEKEILDIAIKMGFKLESARDSLVHVCGRLDYTLESLLDQKIKDFLEQFVANDGYIDRREFTDLVAVIYKLSKGRLSEPNCQYKIKELIQANRWELHLDTVKSQQNIPPAPPAAPPTWSWTTVSMIGSVFGVLVFLSLVYITNKRVDIAVPQLPSPPPTSGHSPTSSGQAAHNITAEISNNANANAGQVPKNLHNSAESIKMTDPNRQVSSSGPSDTSTPALTHDGSPPSNKMDPEYSGLNFGRFVALVIGNNEYRYVRKLENAVADAETVATILENDYGFSVTRILNGTREDVISTLDQMRGALGDKDNLLIYFAGHGFYDQAADSGYWLPVDARANTRVNWISNADVTDSVKAIQAQHILIIADSCYAGTLTRSLEAKLPSLLTARAIEHINSLRSRTVLAAGSIEPVLDGGARVEVVTGDDKQHSIFTAALITALRDNATVMDGSALFTQIRGRVQLDADQIPVYNNIRSSNHEIGGDFFFVRR